MASAGGQAGQGGQGGQAEQAAHLVQAVYSFKGKNNDELCFKKGEVIVVSQRDDGGWWEGTLGETTGWFPSNYVRECKEERAQGSRAPHEVQAFRNVVLDDIADSERAHVLELRNLVHHFLAPLEKADVLARDEYRQLTGNISEVLRAHEDLSAAVEACADQRVGGLFLQRAPALEAVHREYCAKHPRAVCVLDKHRDELNAFMEKCGAACPGLLVLTTGLSKPFRRLQKYPAMLQELGRHALESHPDRGDAHRAVAVYKDIATACAAVRRQKELELQVVTGAVRGWQGAGGSKDLASLGEVLHMGGVALGDAHADRYFVLFPSALLILSVSRRMSAFVYEGCLPLAGITATKLEDDDDRKNAFEISGALIDTVFAVCQSDAEAQKWVQLLGRYSGSDSAFRRSPFKTSPTEASLSGAATPQGISNHKRSHSFNNHHSYAQHLQQQKQRDRHDKNGWIQSSCDALLAQTKSPALASRSASFAPRSTTDEATREGRYRESKRWSSKCLRPAPPLRPVASDRGGDETAEAAGPYAPRRGKVNSYEEDALVLRVIEAYCSSARSRNALNSAGSGRSSCGNARSRASSDSNRKGTFERSVEADCPGRPETRKLLTERKTRSNNSNLSVADSGRGNPARRSAPPLDAAPTGKASSPPVGCARLDRGAVLLPARAPSLPLASAWCCGSFAKQLRKTHHFD